ncbi:MAG: hypothetical protein J6T10_17280 [Methanobrevibacter sp.]|nr:hypothetical protein [Methanobrevibacter sp.]
MSQIKLNSIIGVDKMRVEQLTLEYKANRLFWKGYKAMANSLHGHVTPNLRPNFDRVIHNIAEYKANMLAIRVQIKNMVKPAIERMQSVQQTATTQQVDPQLVNLLRTLFDANPQLKAQVQALLATIALQSVQQHQ